MAHMFWPTVFDVFQTVLVQIRREPLEHFSRNIAIRYADFNLARVWNPNTLKTKARNRQSGFGRVFDRGLNHFTMITGWALVARLRVEMHDLDVVERIVQGVLRVL